MSNGLPPEDLELLARARRQRREERAPDALRRRARASALAEAARAEAVRAVPAAALVPIARPSLRLGLRLLALAALVPTLLVGMPLVLRTVSQRWAQGPEPRSSADWQTSSPAGELLSPSSPLLRLPLLPLPADEPFVSGPNLLGERPFSLQSQTWQVRRWNDPKGDPAEAASYDFKEGALCVTLGAGERALGGWPWPAPGEVAPQKVPLTQGRPYRLGFRAWVRGPLPAQVLLGVGHIQFPFVAAAAARVQVSDEPARFAMDFVAARADDAVGVAFLASNGRQADATRVCLSDVTLAER